MGDIPRISEPEKIAWGFACGKTAAEVAKSIGISLQALDKLMPHILGRYGVRGLSSLAVHTVRYLMDDASRASFITKACDAVASLPFVLPPLQERLVDSLRDPEQCNQSITQIGECLKVDRQTVVDQLAQLADRLACSPTIPGIAVMLQMPQVVYIRPHERIIAIELLTKDQQAAIPIILQGWSFTKTVAHMEGPRRAGEKALRSLIDTTRTGGMANLCGWLVRHALTDDQRRSLHKNRYFVQQPPFTLWRLIGMLRKSEYADAELAKIGFILGVDAETIGAYIAKTYKFLSEDCAHTRMSIVITAELERLSNK